MEDNIKSITEKINQAIDKLNKKDFTIYFFVIDTKGNPNGSTQYIYETADLLISLGYKCAMLHQDKEFVGVGDWLGEKYMKIPHLFVDSDMVKISTADFLIIPEIFANVMNQTKNLPCKRIVLCQNVNHITEFIPIGTGWLDYKLVDVLTTSESQADDIKSLFPYIRTRVVNPSIPNYFRKTDTPQKLTVALLTKEQSVVNKIVKQFYWKCPELSWVSFVTPRGLNREVYADAIRESAITVVIDDDSYFGYSQIEAMKSGSLVIGKIPNVVPEWMYNEDKSQIKSNGLWFSDIRNVYQLIANAIKLWMKDEIPSEIYQEAEATAIKYTIENKTSQLQAAFEQYVSDRISDLNEIKKINESKQK